LLSLNYNESIKHVAAAANVLSANTLWLLYHLGNDKQSALVPAEPTVFKGQLIKSNRARRRLLEKRHVIKWKNFFNFTASHVEFVSLLLLTRLI